MKKIAFMFAAAAMFVACGNTETKPVAEEVEAAPVEEVAEVVAPVLTAEDSATVAAMFEGQEVADSVLQAAYDSILAVKASAEQIVDDAAEIIDEAVDPVAGE